MTQTLTTDVLAQIKADIAARKAMPKHDGSIEVSLERGSVIHRTQGAFSTETVDMLVNALLANREAQPVGYTSAAALDLLSHGQAVLIHKDAETTTFIEEEYRDVVPLFTYAPAVASGENCWSCGKFFTYAQHSECDGYCPHCNAPVDLDEGELNDEG